MKTGLFTNFTDKEFVGYWDGKGKKFAPGQSLYMPDYLARHFAKHLVNRELLKPDGGGNLVYKDGDKMTSPKFPEQVPLFMELFNKAYTPDETEDLGEKKDDIDALIGAANKNRKEKVGGSEVSTTTPTENQDPTQPQVVLSPDFEDSDEESFGGSPKDN